MTVFSTILVANRGEIASRVIRSAQKMGIKCVAIYVEADKNAPYLAQADQSIKLDTSYLDADAILNAAKVSHSEAIHPGYGFLSENAKFASSVEQSGLVWIGPSANVISQMGDKLKAKDIAESAGLPTLPIALKKSDIDSIGFPLLIKAAAGGGGKGMRVVKHADELDESVNMAQKEALNAFADDTVFFESYISQSRHIEIQVLGDNHGNIIHLGERECSIQRRHQKIIEESPSPRINSTLREQLGDAAVSLAKKINYQSAGTVEFLFDDTTGKFWFLEMNTRLQVEHGVTELVTGLDLVELQIQAAAGETLPISQEDVSINGHAIEVRVYPEDPKTFMPDAGDITDLHQPEGEFIRIDSALCNGYTVELDYEPLMAKIMAWGKDRDQAIKTLQRALLEFRVEGVKCNVPLLRDILATKEFVAATYHTGSMPIWLEEFQIRAQNKCSNGKMHKNGNGHKSGNANNAKNGHKTGQENGEREIAAAIGVSLAMTMKSAQPVSLAPFSPWRVYGRREQLLSRTLGNRGWQ